MKLKTAMMVFFLLGASLLLSCNASPTVPIPPPEITMIFVSTPDIDGNVNVNGQPSVASDGDIVLVFNDDTGYGAMKEAAVDGSFEVTIQAAVNHIIVVQIKRDNRLSSEENLIVP